MIKKLQESWNEADLVAKQKFLNCIAVIISSLHLYLICNFPHYFDKRYTQLGSCPGVENGVIHTMEVCFIVMTLAALICLGISTWDFKYSDICKHHAPSFFMHGLGHLSEGRYVPF